MAGREGRVVEHIHYNPGPTTGLVHSGSSHLRASETTSRKTLSLAAVLFSAVFIAAAVAAQPASAPAWPRWLFPTDAAQVKPVHDGSALTVPGSDVTYTRTQIDNPFAPPDWHPRDHSTMPPIVASGRAPAVMACAFCHTPTGQGRPENSALAGLSADYIAEQLRDMRSGARRAAAPADYAPVQAMHQLASELTDAEIEAAAQYFSQQILGPRVEVIEGARIPEAKPAAWIYAREGMAEEDLGARIIEMAPDFALHERRDDRMRYVAYVPAGSIDRGRLLATTGAGRTQACAGCHDVDMHGTALGPAIAGRSPSYLMRQLLAFQRKARTSARAQMMQPVVERLTSDDMIALAAYVASLPLQ
jgi:cytochrome c553